jgi:RimJ/RimL family protein N-acetyltransferase
MLKMETERLWSRPLTMDDLDELAAMRADPDVARYLGNGQPHAREQVATRMRFYLKCYETHGFGMCATMLKGEERMVGGCGLQPLEETGEIEVGYSFIKPLWGQGLATEVTEGWLKFGFLEKNLDRIVAVALPPNVASYRVMEKVGMKFEGRRVHYGEECICYAISREDFLVARPHLKDHQNEVQL